MSPRIELATVWLMMPHWLQRIFGKKAITKTTTDPRATKDDTSSAAASSSSNTNDLLDLPHIDGDTNINGNSNDNNGSDGACHQCGGHDYGPGSEETSCFCHYTDDREELKQQQRAINHIISRPLPSSSTPSTISIGANDGQQQPAHDHDDNNDATNDGNGSCTRCGGHDYGPGSDETTCFCNHMSEDEYKRYRAATSASRSRDKPRIIKPSVTVTPSS